MTDRDLDISDETLTAFLDAELPADEQASIAARLEADPALAARLAALEAPLDRLRVGMDRLASLAPPPPSQSLPSQSLRLQPQRKRAGAMAAVLLLGLGLGAAGMAVLNSQTTRGDWQDYAAAYHLLYRAETLRGIVPQTDFTAMSDAIGLDLAAFATASELPILRAQILGYGDAPIVQLAYLRDGTPYAFCITLADGPARAMTQAEREGLATASWSDGAHDFLLIGGAGAVSVAEDAAYFQRLLL